MIQLQPRRWALPGIALLGAMLGLASAAPAANVALNKPASATINAATAGNVDDNDLATEWNTGDSLAAPADFVAIDLGAEVNPQFARVFWSANQPRGFTIEVATTADLSDPDTNPNFGQGDWQTAYVRTSADPQPKSPDLMALTPPSPPSGHTGYRYIRISGLEGPSDTAFQWGVLEFQVLDAPLPTLSGVTKTSGGTVANAVVQITGPIGTGFLANKSVLSDSNGAYSIAGLDPGDYTVRGLAPGQYAPVSASVTVANANVTQDLTFSTVAHNSTAALPGYGLDFIASSANAGNQNAQTNGNALPSDELPPGNQVWNTNTALPGTGMIGASMPPTLSFFFPPTADGQNNVINAANAVIPFAAAHYTAVYMLQVAGDQPAYVNATINYADGTSEPVLTGSGSNSYAFNLGTGDAGEDEVTAFTVDRMVNTGGDAPGLFNVFMRAIPVNSAKVLKNITFGDYISGTGSGTFSRGFILGYSADSTDTPAALGSIAGHVKFGANGVSSALVRFLSYRATTDATGAYKFNSVPAGAWTLTASKAANYPATSITPTIAAGENKTDADIVFANPIPVVTELLSNPVMDVVSGDANIKDATPTGWMLGREYIPPMGVYSPATVANPPADPLYKNKPPWEASQAIGVPDALKFIFTDLHDTPITVGQPGYPEGATPNAAILHGSTFLAPQGVNIYNAYFLEIGAEGGTVLAPIIRYTDGTSEQKVVNVSDWFGTNTADELPYLIMHGRHQINDGAESNQGDNVKMNVLTLAINPNKTVKEIFWPEGIEPNKYPIVLAVSWEVDHLPDPASNVNVVVKKSDGTPANRAVVKFGPYVARTDATGTATFNGVPAGVTVGVSAYLNGQTKAATQSYVIPSGQKPATLNISLPAAAPIFVQLPLAYDYDLVAAASMPGDYKGAPQNDRGFAAEELPQPTAISGQSIVANGVPYIMPQTADFYSNALRLNGQTINVAPGHYSALNVITTGMGTGATRMFYATFTYDDGTKDEVQYGSTDWVWAWNTPDESNRRLYFLQEAPPANLIAPTRRYSSDDQALPIAFVPQSIPVNPAKNLVSVTFLPIMRGIDNDDCSVLAATLQANDTAATGTITGTVVGKVAGAAASGPIERAMVKWDTGHAAYTDATGNFTINNVPLGAANLTVTAEGSGILTKTFPVTVTATTNAGTLNLGNAATAISITLGDPNQPNGLFQVEGYPTYVAKDGNRPAFKYTVPDSGSAPITVNGVTARTTVYNNSYLYFQVDKGWIHHGLMGKIGLDPSTFTITNNKFVGRLGPDLYMRITYLDRGTDTLGVHYNRMEGNIFGATSTPTNRMTNNYANPLVFDKLNQDGTVATKNFAITKTDTGQWKSAIVSFNGGTDANGINNAFGAYAGENLEADFRIWGGGGAGNSDEIISKVEISTLPFVPSASATDALRIAAGLQASTAGDVTALDVTGPGGTKDGKITILDVTALAKQ